MWEILSFRLSGFPRHVAPGCDTIRQYLTSVEWLERRSG
jgi:hypothetical protein